MLTQLEVEDYQSIHKASIQVGGLTVITGPSSSGKSALVRAMRTLVFNAKGTSYISHGAKSCMILMVTEDSWVKIVRGSKDRYEAQPLEPPHQQVVWTKLAGKVPQGVTDLLAMSEINFAGQFDRPYLLTDSAGEVARTLGELTGVTMVFAAAREANTTRQRLSHQLGEARQQVADLSEQLQGFRGLPQRREAAAAAVEAFQQYQEKQEKAQQLRDLLDRAVQYLEAVTAVPPMPALPAIETLDTLDERSNDLNRLILTYLQASQYAGQAGQQAAAYAAEVSAQEQELHDVLAEAGVCPTCGQSMK